MELYHITTLGLLGRAITAHPRYQVGTRAQIKSNQSTLNLHDPILSCLVLVIKKRNAQIDQHTARMSCVRHTHTHTHTKRQHYHAQHVPPVHTHRLHAMWHVS
jgi:hypothetical protein